MKACGWVKLHRKITEWGWYQDSHMVHLFIHLIASANHKDGEWRGTEVKKGQLICGLHSLSETTGITTRSLRTCLSRLEQGNEITRKTTNKFTIITVCKYEEYQSEEVEDRQTNDKQTTNKRQTNDNKQECKECKNEKNEEKLKHSRVSSEPCPHLEIVKLYNEKLPQLPAVKPSLWNGTRKKHLQARWMEDEERQTLTWWENLFDSVGKSPFLLGEGPKGWRADLGWIVIPSNLVKILEGKYTDQNGRRGTEDDEREFEERLARLSKLREDYQEA